MIKSQRSNYFNCVVPYLADVHETPSSSTNSLLTDNPHDQLAVLNVYLGKKIQQPHQNDTLHLARRTTAVKLHYNVEVKSSI